MDANSWLWVALIAFLLFCCVPMLFTGRRRDKREAAHSDSDPQPRDLPEERHGPARR